MKAKLILAAALAVISANLWAKGPENGIDKGNCTLYQDIRYGAVRADLPENDPTSDRLLDVYVPKGEAPKGGWPVVMFVHGGGFSGGAKAEKYGLNPVGAKLLERGYAVVSINYLLWHHFNKVKGASCGAQMKDGLPKAGVYIEVTETAIRVASEDAALALKWIKKNGKKFGINPGFIAITGGSAGAITCLYTAFVRPPKGVKIRAVVNCWGAMSDPDKLINDPTIPVLTIHGDKDALINVCYSDVIQKRLEAIGSDRSKLIVMEGKGHAQYKYVATSLMDEFVGFLDSLR